MNNYFALTKSGIVMCTQQEVLRRETYIEYDAHARYSVFRECG